LNNERVITGVVKGMVVVVKEWSGWIKVWFPCGQDFFAVVGAWSTYFRRGHSVVRHGQVIFCVVKL